MRTIPDSNVLLDVIGRPTDWAAWSIRQLKYCYETGTLVLNQVVYAEIARELDSREALDLTLERLRIEKEQVPFEACFSAGQAHRAYRRNGGRRERVLPDFLIGAHAAHGGYRVLTRDAQRYRAYFPEVDVIAPDTHA
jgi:predicted nucleic acid-binding protein